MTLKNYVHNFTIVLNVIQYIAEFRVRLIAKLLRSSLVFKSQVSFEHAFCNEYFAISRDRNSRPNRWANRVPKCAKNPGSIPRRKLYQSASVKATTILLGSFWILLKPTCVSKAFFLVCMLEWDTF